jgi:hypothetical protein
MKRYAAPVLLGSLLALSACASSHLPPAPPVTQAQLDQTRAEFQQSHPDARVGIVTDVLPDSHLASVGSVNIADFSVGDIVTFLDSNRQTLTLGTVERVNPDTVTVRFSDPLPSGRVPAVGDMAVRFVH